MKKKFLLVVIVIFFILGGVFYFFKNHKWLEITQISVQKELVGTDSRGNEKTVENNDWKEDLIELDSVWVYEDSSLGVLINNDIKTAKWLVLPLSMDWYLSLNWLESAENLILPKKIWALSLNWLSSHEWLVLHEDISEYFSFNWLSSANGLVFPKNVKGSISLLWLKDAQWLVLPEEVWALSIDWLVNGKWLILPKKIKWFLSLNWLVSLKDVVLPKEVEGYLSIKWVNDLENLISNQLNFLSEFKHLNLVVNRDHMNQLVTNQLMIDKINEFKKINN